MSTLAVSPPASAANQKPTAVGATDLSALEDASLTKWLDIHHNPQQGVFLSIVQDKAGHTVTWAYGPFLLEIAVSFTGVTGQFGVNIPLRGYKKLIDINGDLINGISAAFNFDKIVFGTIKIYLKRRLVILELDAKAFGQEWKVKIALLSL
ncbi:hypothetical protein BOTBODRAFT_46400 [Botryobasidium botryosum FD-172 SS1]|uniref:Uncharacterized protein n=1 Tax=Botryobasidium botryosum (strain FD-172 SS1) TaxID=930990 RepID=A0A067M9R1_BOTB1|nr:hypothetical protein BOTBODRAFT_46400 [Botryobasidium botryosum FD-172 SS1]